MIQRLRQEDGIALVIALLFTVVLSVLVFSMTSYVSSNEDSAKNSSSEVLARSYAEAALQTAYSRLIWSNQQTQINAGYNPSKPNLLGCVASASASTVSDCSSPTPLCLKFTATSCPSPYTATAGTGVVYGFYPGTSPASGSTFQGVTEAASTWILVAKGYATNSSGALSAATLKGTVQITAGGSGVVASVWNHIFLTAPWTQGVCGTTFSGNTTTLDMPIYTIGNLCFTGNTVGLQQTTGGQNIDLQVGGTLYYGGQGDYIGSSTNKIYSAAVVMGCSTTAAQLAAATSTNHAPACVNGSSPAYWTQNAGSYVSQNDPELTNAQVETDYASFDPGPKHPCLSGTTPSALATSALDYNIGSTEGTSSMPDNSGSGSSGGVFDLTPSSSYACVSQSGLGTGYLIWNGGSTSTTVTVTVNGTTSSVTVAAKQLAINGSVFIDGPIKVSQSMTYKGTGIVMAAGQISFPTNSTTICAQNTSCTYSNWQGSSGNNDMLTLATLLDNSSTAINWTGQGITFQGSLWCRPKSTFYLTGQGNPQIQGPLSVGSMNINGNSFSFKPLPVIQNMPVGAPVPPNVSATVNALHVIG